MVALTKVEVERESPTDNGSDSLSAPEEFHLGDRYWVQLYRGRTYDENLNAIRRRAADLHGRIFETNPLDTVEEILDKLRSRSSSVAFIKPIGSDKDVAFAAMRVYRFTTESGRAIDIMYSLTRAVLPEHRRTHIGRSSIQLADSLYQPDAIAFRSQNEGSVSSVLNSGRVVDLNPFTGVITLPLPPAGLQELSPEPETYDKDPLKQKVLEYLVGRITPERLRYEKAERGEPLIDLRTGLCFGVYPEGQNVALNAFVEQPKSDEKPSLSQQVRDRMKKLGLDYTRGDGIIAIGWTSRRFRTAFAGTNGKINPQK